jgi:hypothetical protein
MKADKGVMTSGQLELLIGKVAYIYSKASREMADVMREFWQGCQREQANEQGEQGEQGEQEIGEPGLEPAKQGVDSIEQTRASTSRATSRATDFNPPFDERGRYIEEKEEETVKLTALEQAKIKGRYNFWLKKINSSPENDAVTLDAFKGTAREAMKAGVLSPEQWKQDWTEREPNRKMPQGEPAIPVAAASMVPARLPVETVKRAVRTPPARPSLKLPEKVKNSPHRAKIKPKSNKRK